MQIGEIICEGERSYIFVDPPSLLSRYLFLDDTDKHTFKIRGDFFVWMIRIIIVLEYQVQRFQGGWIPSIKMLEIPYHSVLVTNFQMFLSSISLLDRCYNYPRVQVLVSGFTSPSMVLKKFGLIAFRFVVMLLIQCGYFLDHISNCRSYWMNQIHLITITLRLHMNGTTTMVLLSLEGGGSM